MRKKLSIAIIALFIIAFGISLGLALTRERFEGIFDLGKVETAIGDLNGVPAKNVEVVTVTYGGKYEDEYSWSVDYRVYKNGEWQPPEPGIVVEESNNCFPLCWMSIVSVNKDGQYTATNVQF